MSIVTIQDLKNCTLVRLRNKGLPFFPLTVSFPALILFSAKKEILVKFYCSGRKLWYNLPMINQNILIKKMGSQADFIAWLSRHMVEIPTSYIAMLGHAVMMILANRRFLKDLTRIEKENMETLGSEDLLVARQRLEDILPLQRLVLKVLKELKAPFPIARIFDHQIGEMENKQENFLLATDPEIRTFLINTAEKINEEQAVC